MIDPDSTKAELEETKSKIKELSNLLSNSKTIDSLTIGELKLRKQQLKILTKYRDTLQEILK